jgi:hypothetical protein
MLTIGKQVSHSLKIQKNDKAGMDNRFPYLSQVVRLITIPNGWDPNWNDSDLQTGEQVFASVSCKSRALSESLVQGQCEFQSKCLRHKIDKLPNQAAVF